MESSYSYDGSFEGFLCCVFESYAAKEIPQTIISADLLQHTLFDNKKIETDEKKAKRVLRALQTKLGKEACNLLLRAHLTCLTNRERYMLLFIRSGFAHGPAVMNHLADPDLQPLFAAVRYLESETHQYTGFVRFSIHDEKMYASITPKNRVLPLLRPHSCRRFPEESFLIYDKTHREVLLYNDGKHLLTALEKWEIPETDDTERAFRQMWKRFYHSIAIESRINPKLRKSHLPQRYWPDMIEFQVD